MPTRPRYKAKLRSLSLSGWKSIRSLDPPLVFGDINILVGANGSGKSNLISFFRLLNRMIAGKLQEFVGLAGSSESLLFLGAKTTSKIEAILEFDSKDGSNRYFLRLMQAASDQLIFSEERLEFRRAGASKSSIDILGAGHRETLLKEEAARERGNPATTDDGKKSKRIANVTFNLLKNCRVFHFHDTSDSSAMRRRCYVNDNRQLHPDGGNLAAMLHLYRVQNEPAYQRIVSTLRKIINDFDDFMLEPDRVNSDFIRLDWKRVGNDYAFGPHQFSDGSLRSIALVTLLMQPREGFPDAIILDEPELGLHPYALILIAGLIRAASLHTQIVVATQSASLLDHFQPDEIVVAESRHGESRFRRLEAAELATWLEDYTLGELWRRNVLGGGPMP